MNHFYRRGFVLVPVIMALVVVAALAMLLNVEGPMQLEQVAAEAEATQVDNLTRAGLAHAAWQLQDNECGGDFVVTTTNLGSGSYTAAMTGPGTTTSYSLAVDQDAWIRSDLPTVNNGATIDQHIRIQAGNIEHALYRFNLAALPAGAQINSASAWFYIEATGEHPEGSITVHRVTHDWTETDASWNSMNGKFESAVIAAIPAQASGAAWVQVNLTAQVQAWVNGQPNYGILMASNAEGVHAEYVSKEGAGGQLPRLDVIVGSTPPSPVSIQATATLSNGNTRSLSQTASPAHQPPGTLSLQLGFDPGEDAMPDSFYFERNYGGATYMQVNERLDWYQRPLIRFEISELPHGAQVISAQLALYSTGFNTPGSATLHRVTQSWLEGTKSGTGQPDGSTWLTYDGLNNWSSVGGDFDLNPVAEAEVTTTGAWVSWEIAPVVQQWLDGVPNYGVLIKSDGVLRDAEFATKERADPTIAPKLTITYACECSVACLVPQGSGKVLLVVSNGGYPSPSEAVLKASLESWGYTVDTLDMYSGPTAYDNKIAVNDVVYVPASIDPTKVASKLTEASIGVVSELGALNDELGIATSSAAPVGASITITDTNHYITAPFPAGALEIYAADMAGLTVAGSSAGGAQTLAEWGADGALVALEQGAAEQTGGADYSGDGLASGRRVMLPIGGSGNFNWDYLNNNGRLIVQRAIDWAKGAVLVSSGDILLVVVDPGSLNAQENAKKALFEAWGYSVTLIDESDSQANFNTAIAANDVAYIPQEITSSNLGTKLVNAPIGVVNEEGDLVDEIGFAQDRIFYSRHEIDVVDNSHYITEPFSIGLLTFVSSDQSVQMLDAPISPDLQTLGQTFNVGTSWKPSLATLAPGDELWNGGIAAGRRAQLPWGGGTFDVATLNGDGQTIMRRAIEWAAGAGCGVTTPLLFVVSDVASPTSAEIARQDLIESWCYAVNLIDDGATAGDFATAMASNTVVYVSHDVTLQSVGTILRDFTIGVVNEEFLLTDELGFSGGYGSAMTTTLDIVDDAHEITAGFTSGALTIFDSNAAATGAAVVLAPTRRVLGKVASVSALMALETGSQLYGGGAAAGRRVQVPWGYVFSALNSDGQTLMQQAIAWASETGTPGSPLLLVVSDDNAPTDEEIERKHLFESWGYMVTVVEDADPQANFDVFAALNDVAYISEEVDHTLLTTKLRNAPIGVVNEERMLYSYLGFTNAVGAQTGMSVISVTDNTHDITTGFALGNLTVTASGQPMQYLQGVLTPDLKGLADHPSVANPALAVLETGDALYGGGNAAGPRVWLPWGGDAFVFSALNTDGRTLLQRALQWAGGGGGGGGAVVYEGFSEAKLTINDDTLDVAKPVGTSSGDLLIMALATDGGTDTSFSVPAGWTMIDTGNSSSKVSFGVWWKLAGGSEPANYTLSWTGNERAYAMVLRFSGHDPVNPIDVSASGTGSSASPSSPAVATSVADALIVRLGGFDDDDITVDAPGLSSHITITMDESDASNFSVSAGAGYLVQASPGDSGTSTFSLTASEEYRTVTIAIAPQ